MFKRLLALFICLFTSLTTFADGGVFWDKTSKWEDMEAALKKWEIHVDDIPNIIRNAIDYFMAIAWTIAVIFIIIGAFQILIGSLEQNKTKGKTTVVLALTWFAIASLAWFIVKFILDNFG